ncbi:MAG: hypothetical protein HFH94_12570 [Lachnospiraceae bacterium]|nr:transposase [uncultured Acetatifactor sp.]MCI9220551.1 hypothetical protein [Lachnospiraceae bacterium]
MLDFYGIELSSQLVSKIMAKIHTEIRERRSRPLSPAYPFAFIDYIHYKERWMHIQPYGICGAESHVLQRGFQLLSLTVLGI